jgi:REP element-mobilizing transposase RayT
MDHPDYRRKLPHYLPNDAPYFVTTRLAGSLSPPEIAMLKALRGTVEEARFFLSYDESLDRLHDGIDHLRRDPFRDIVRAKLIQLESKQLISIHAFCVMPNHIHLVIDVVGAMPLFDIMKLLKGATSRECNKLLGKTGKHFWQYESYDHVVRRGSLERIIRYVIMNPVKAGLVTNWWEWPGTYLSPRYDRRLFDAPN